MKYLTSDSPESLVPYYNSLANRPQCLEFYEVLTTGKPAGWSSKKGGSRWLESMQDIDFANNFTTAMDSRGSYLAKILAEKSDIGKYTSLLDVAGGSGIYACSIAQRHTTTRIAVLEIPPVNLAAMRSIESKGMSSKVQIISGDMFKYIPEGFDIHLFANAFHDWDIDSLKQIATNSYQSLNKEGKIAIFDAHLNDDKNGPLAIAEYSCLLMHSTEGKCYSIKEIFAILESVGFTGFAVQHIAADRTLITANKE
jgi:acetylserotonin N-methyltransferase